jgi:signal transduction histidine kinase
MRGTEASLVGAELSRAVDRWSGEHPALTDTLRPLSSLVPPPSGESDPLHASIPSISREELAQALHQTGLNLCSYCDDWGQELLDTMNRRLRALIQETGAPAPGGVLSRTAPGEISEELIRRQMADTLRVLIAGVTHDTNNMLAALIGAREEAEEERQHLYELADSNKHVAPAEVGIRYLESNRALQKNLHSAKDLLDLTVKLVREVQSVAGLAKGPSERENANLPRLFIDGGVIQRIGLILVDLLAGIQEAGRNLAEMNGIAAEYGHLAPPDVQNEGKRLRGNIGECLATLQEFTSLLVELFRVFRSVAERLGPADLHRHLNPRLIGALVGKGVAVALNLDQEPWMIPGPAIYAWQVGMNLMVNARDAMADRGRLDVATRKAILREEDVAELVRRSALLRPAPRRGEFMVLQVRDNGTGIPEAILSRIFDLSFSGKKSSGLGLAVTLKIVEDMGGFIAVDTAVEGPSRGTTFSVYFPRVPDTP